MEFDVKVRARKEHPYSADDKKIAQDFANKVEKDLGEFLKAVVMFGSAAKRPQTEKSSDIDVLIIVDDASFIVTKPLTEAYRIIVEKYAVETSLRLHISTLKTTNYWEQVKNGDPVIINILRDGLPLIDRGVFAPVQALLDQGRIRPTKESIWSYYGRAGPTMKNAQWHIMQACVDLYWAAIDASHAALMSVGVVPPSPIQVPEMLEEHLVKKGLLPKKYPVMMRELYDLSKHIQHRDLKELSGAQYDGYYKETQELVDVLKDVVKKHEH